jgi:hypothetical protein
VSLTHYPFRWGFSAFFEFPTENARRILPRGVEPFEVHHGSSIFSVTGFEFTQSEVGPYGEVVFGVIVPPLIAEGQPFPRSAFFPWQLGTTTRASREHAIERWHLPHWPDDVMLRFVPAEGSLGMSLEVEGSPAVEMTITEYTWQPATHLYQCLMQDESGAYMSSITMRGEFTEHEEETGRLRLHDHPFNKEIMLAEVSETPFREIWYRDGVQSFHGLVARSAA